MKRVILLAVAACSGGTKAPAKPTGSNPAGVIWETAAEPWHVMHAGFRGQIEGDRVTFAGPSGWVYEVSLTTGRPLRERKLEMGMVTSLLALGDGRLLAVGFAGKIFDSPPVAFVLDANLEPRRVELPVRAMAKGLYVFPDAIRIGDSIVISGPGLALSLYDPKDLSVKSTLDNQLGWRRIGGSGQILLAERGGELRRFDLETNGQRKVAYSIPSHVVAAEGATIVRETRDGRWAAVLHRDDGTLSVLPGDIDSLHAYDAKHFVTTKQHELRIHELPSGEIRKRIALEDPNTSLANITITGRRAAMAWNGIVRLIDLETGTVTPKQTTARQAMWLAVGNDGTVLAGNPPEVWMLAGGKPSTAERLGEDFVVDAMRTDDPRHYVTAKTIDRKSTMELHTVGTKASRVVAFEHTVDATYLDRAGAPLFVVDGPDSKQLMRLDPGGPHALFAFHTKADVLAADPDSELLISLQGRVATVTRDGTLVSTLRAPHCEQIYRFAAIDSTSARAITHDQKDLALWNRKTDTLLATAKVGATEDLLFLPKRDELLLTFEDRVVLWSPTKGTRTLPWPGVLEPAASPDGKKLALSFRDGRVGVYDLDVLLAAPLGPDLPAGDPLPETCDADDPLSVTQASDDDDHDDHDDEDPPPPEEPDED